MLTATIKQTLMITSFVMVMMLILEYINILTHGNLNKPFKRSGWLQIVTAGLLGVIPGCLGSYTTVTMYAHKIYSFPALVTTMIATSGDEAFLMFSVMPGTAVFINISLFAIAVTTGFVLYAFMKNKTFMALRENHMRVHHEHPGCICFSLGMIKKQITHISFQRAFLISLLLLFIFFLLAGDFGHSHDFSSLLPQNIHDPGHDHGHHSEWNWIKITFLALSAISLFIITTADDHFIEEHLWKHILKKHFLKIFLWTFGALLVLFYINEYLEPGQWVKANQFTIMLIAVLLGLIPQSGPHFIFIFLFMQGSIPLSILMANSIVQDGHGAIPLLAESGKSFILMKAVNLLVGLIIGFSGIIIGW